MATVNLAIGGMTCAACVRRVEQAVVSVPGVRSARISLATGQTTVEHNGTTSLQALRAAVENIGYSFEPRRGVVAQVRAGLVALSGRPLLIGPAAGLALLGLYLGLIALAQGWPHALEQFEEDRPFVLALATGFALQAGLYARLRARSLADVRGTAGMAASSSTSAAAMLACCAHHLTDVLPLLGISGLAVLLGAYKMPLLWLGLAMNLAAITYLIWQVHRREAAPVTAFPQGVPSI